MVGQTAILWRAMAPFQGLIHPHFQSSAGHRNSVFADLPLRVTITQLRPAPARVNEFETGAHGIY
jgi:hypothetical protein